MTCMDVHFPAVELENLIWFVPFSGCQVFCGIVPNGAADLVVSFSIGQGLKC